MKRYAKIAAFIVLIWLAALLLYGAQGFYDAVRAGPELAARADRLIAANRGAAGLGPGRIEILLKVEDPGFWRHGGIDMSTPGAGRTSITQSLSKRIGFDRFRPGLRKIRQSGYALGLERSLSKHQILALFLDTAEMGPGRRGRWVKGFYTGSLDHFGRPPAALDQRQFLALLAVMIAPREFSLHRPDPGLDERVARIERLIAHQCRPLDNNDVRLEGCARR
jgi:membrane carboxypeptidase/penicillin-binding protein PbpC